MASTSTGRGGEASSARSSSPSVPISDGRQDLWKHDVFLSFRGEDTRTTFTDHLYHALEDAGVNVFRDSEGLWRGEGISSGLLDAIRGARISIVVFSKNYAESSWCLEELATIMECRQAAGQLVLPVFYDVDPSDVRRQGGSFLAAFLRQEQRFMSEQDKVSRWKTAATEAGSLSGWDLTNATDRYEGKTIKMIVRAVLDELKQTHLDVAKYPVGLESRLEELSSLLEVGASIDVRFVGICGMGGVGKTTLAKALYNKFVDSFPSKCFLADVRENFDRPDGPVHLQERLLSDLLKLRKFKLADTHQGTNVIQDRLAWKRVLIVLDDVSSSEELAILARERDWFGRGSRIIVTTRNLDLLKDIKADSVYMARELNDEESLQLFSQHALMNSCLREELTDLLQEITSYCKGLPLALQVVGSSLLDRSIEEWRSLSKKLKEIPHNRIQSQMRISFDTLGDDKEKDLFLHIACFFVGFDKDYVVKIMDGCGLFAEFGISVLRRRCLLEIDKENKLKIHDLIRDMGREIVREKSPSNPGKRSRLWFHDDALCTLEDSLGTEEVEGLTLNLPESRTIKVHAEAFTRMKRLRLLQLKHVHIDGGYQLLPNELRWLCWHGFPLTHFPKEFSMARLVVIDLQHSNLRELRKDNKMFLGNLKILNLSYSPFLTKTPDFSKLPNLEELILRDCQNLAEVHPTIGCLERLELLNLRNCGKLGEIPSSICQVKSMRILDISGCRKISQLPEDFGHMEFLTEFLAEGTGITEIPFSVRRLKNLTKLSLRVWEKLEKRSVFSVLWQWVSPKLHPRTMNARVDWLLQLSSLRTLRLANCNLSNESIPRGSIESLQNLENLDLSGSRFSALPETIRHLPKLEKLILDGCSELESLPSMPESLFVLSAANCISLSYSRDYVMALMSNVRRRLPPGAQKFDIHQLQSARAIIRMEWCTNLQSCENLASDRLKSFLLEDDNFNTMGDCFVRRSNIPDWFDYQGSGPSLSFRMPPSQTCKLKSVTICVVYATEGIPEIESPAPVYRVTVTNKGRALELTHETGKGRDTRKNSHPFLWDYPESFAWLLHLPHQIVFRDELSFEGEVEVTADSGSSNLCVRRIGIHFGSQVCRYCRFDSSTRSAPLSGMEPNRRETMPSSPSCEFDLFKATPSRPRET